MELVFEWDPEKEAANIRKHGISFDEASTAFGDPLAVTVDDADHSQIDTRYILLGSSDRGRASWWYPTPSAASASASSARDPRRAANGKAYERGY